MRVTVKGAFGVAVRSVITGEVPDDERLVTRSGQEHVGAGWARSVRLLERVGVKRILLERGSQAGYPARVTLKGAAEDELLRHVDECRNRLLRL